MEPAGLLPYLQQPANCPYTQTDQSSPRLPFHFLTIHFNIFSPCTIGFSKWSLSLRFTHQHPVYNSPFPKMCYMPRPAHSAWFDHSNNIWWGVQIITLLVTYSRRRIY